MNNKKRNIFIIIMLVIFAILAVFISIKDKLIIDEYGYNIVTIFKGERLTKIVKFITLLASAKVLISLTIIMFLLLKNKHIALCVAFNLLLISSSNALIKNIFKRPRPQLINLIEEHGYSFPSGHSITATAFYGLGIYLTLKYVKQPKLKKLLIIIQAMTIILVALSRVYLGVHYFSDVLGGIVLGTVYLYLYITVIEKYKLI